MLGMMGSVHVRVPLDAYNSTEYIITDLRARVKSFDKIDLSGLCAEANLKKYVKYMNKM